MLLKAQVGTDDLRSLLGRYGAQLVAVELNTPVPGSYWGESEAGLLGNRVYVRDDTPAHSLLHELSHFVCMTPDRRANLCRDAGGDSDEECAVCYLQVILADELSEFGRERCCDDMDTWGYSFREGHVRAWFNGDGSAAQRWLFQFGLIDADSRPTWRLREV